MNTPTPTQTQGGEAATPRTDETAHVIRFLAKRFEEDNLTFYQFIERVDAQLDGLRNLERETATLHAQLGEERRNRAADREQWAHLERNVRACEAQIARMKQREGELVGALRLALPFVQAKADVMAQIGWVSNAGSVLSLINEKLSLNQK